MTEHCYRSLTISINLTNFHIMALLTDYQIIHASSNPVLTLSHDYKLSLVGMQLPEKYKENFDVSSEGPSSGNFVN